MSWISICALWPTRHSTLSVRPCRAAWWRAVWPSCRGKEKPHTRTQIRQSRAEAAGSKQPHTDRHKEHRCHGPPSPSTHRHPRPTDSGPLRLRYNGGGAFHALRSMSPRVDPPFAIACGPPRGLPSPLVDLGPRPQAPRCPDRHPHTHSNSIMCEKGQNRQKNPRVDDFVATSGLASGLIASPGSASFRWARERRRIARLDVSLI